MWLQCANRHWTDTWKTRSISPGQRHEEAPVILEIPYVLAMDHTECPRTIGRTQPKVRRGKSARNTPDKESTGVALWERVQKKKKLPKNPERRMLRLRMAQLALLLQDTVSAEFQGKGSRDGGREQLSHAQRIPNLYYPKKKKKENVASCECFSTIYLTVAWRSAVRDSSLHWQEP